MRVPVLSLLLTVSALVAGCGEPVDCRSSCEKLFGDGDGECNLQVPGRDAQDMTNDCLATCNYAMARAGELGDYNPDERSGGNQDVTITNDQQAAAWMDCIAETSCDDLQANYCAPTTNF